MGPGKKETESHQQAKKKNPPYRGIEYIRYLHSCSHFFFFSFHLGYHSFERNIKAFFK